MLWRVSVTHKDQHGRKPVTAEYVYPSRWRANLRCLYETIAASFSETTCTISIGADSKAFRLYLEVNEVT